MGELKRQRQNLENNCRGRERKKKKKTLLTERQDMAVFSSEAVQARRQGKNTFKVLKEKHLLT